MVANHAIGGRQSASIAGYFSVTSPKMDHPHTVTLTAEGHILWTADLCVDELADPVVLEWGSVTTAPINVVIPDFVPLWIPLALAPAGSEGTST